MRELTVKEFSEMVTGGKFEIASVDTWGLYISMVNAEISYNEEDNEITFFKGCKEGTSELAFDVKESIEIITLADDGVINIEFSIGIADVEIRKAVL